jgi:hypothetical protein
MKTFLFSTLFFVFSIGLYAQETEVFCVSFENITHKSATAIWTSNLGVAPTSRYFIEYGTKGFERGQGKNQMVRWKTYDLLELEPDTEYSLFIRGYNTSSTDPVWFVEHTFTTLPCNTEISGIESEEIWTTCCGSNGAVGVFIKWDDTADSYELEYGLKGFQQGAGVMIDVNSESGVMIPSENLTSFTDYDFYIRAKCDDTFGEWTAGSFSTTQLTTGIENIKNANFEIFPNPVEDILHIKFNSTFDLGSVVVNIFDLTGSIRYKSGYKENYNVSLLPTGMYILHIRDEKLFETMIIQKR